jgi:hypothetical protein
MTVEILESSPQEYYSSLTTSAIYGSLVGENLQIPFASFDNFECNGGVCVNKTDANVGFDVEASATYTTSAFIGNLKASSVGLTLTAAKKLIFNDFDYVKGNNDQFMDRIHRINQTEDVDIYFQIFKDTQYEKMWKICMKKGYIISQIIKKESEK